MNVENTQNMADSLAHEETTKKKVKNKKKRDTDQRAPTSLKKNQRKPCPDERSYPRTLKFTYYTELNNNREHIYTPCHDQAPYKRSPPMFKGKGGRKDQNKYCRFHHDHGHDTNDYFDLKDKIEELIR
ncbi:LOW QUALITY PROTEIN: hypothetical protein TorRG33x02_200850 [Trema orientale]|uniref:Uncharacterized protein n=1 Tax=Trema orientale TaxID=63057 RepID=A0A2P5EEV8_TREOI|nr:LOW QUALITY PROTEIN: hypothetical protein TorRG33x02_200850 [Trema orientale]